MRLRTYLQTLLAYWEIKAFIKMNGVKKKRKKFNFYLLKIGGKEFECTNLGYLTMTKINNCSVYSLFISGFSIIKEVDGEKEKVDLEFLEGVLSYFNKHVKNNLCIT